MSRDAVPKNILELSQEEQKKFLDSFDVILTDCDGVVWTLTGGLPGIKEGIESIYKLDKKLAFVSNNSVSGEEKYKSKFAALGVEFDYKKQLVHPAASYVDYLNHIQFDKSKTIFLVGTSVHKRFLDENGYKYIVGHNSYDYEDIGQFYKSMLGDVDASQIGAVCFDVDFNFNLGKFYIAEYVLNKNPECLLLVGGTDPEYYFFDHSFAGWGWWVSDLVKRCPQTTPVYLGKPGDALGRIVMERFAIKDKSRVLFVGDTLEQDIGFANKIGFQTLLVLSGVTTPKMLEDNDKEEQTPDYVAGSLYDFIKFTGPSQ